MHFYVKHRKDSQNIPNPDYTNNVTHMPFIEIIDNMLFHGGILLILGTHSLNALVIISPPVPTGYNKRKLSLLLKKLNFIIAISY